MSATYFFFDGFIGLSPLEEVMRNLEKRGQVLPSDLFPSSGQLNAGVRYLSAPVEVRLLDVTEMIAVKHGYRLMVVRVYAGAMCICSFLHCQVYV